ncbi:Aminomethyltransferase folate-binding domain-containing protein [Aaosphaeria arxii CBS 175.79]|uniref:Iron-sulfur cluster assembly factor IBA57 homolog, mitochondrial n=1 Tax=Aaosphaeria arxii CBS 175.79 TaxID=1450172 RepID=A0A6A5X5Y4_9PLEO|nr:Aminomethyltransferase folate-binding domain-containing protein [Aaosphaeria arxii CBS 175.79]KAF2008388.1 Aminomethyltransferase folate-binding domain-containing protein [Aaosphaeria arxii CBS 175.79]
MSVRPNSASFICTSCSRALRLKQIPTRLNINAPALSATYASAATLNPLRPTERILSSRFIFERTSSKTRIYAQTNRNYASSVHDTIDATGAPQSSADIGPVAKYGLVQLSHRHLISLAGPDAAKFLQGLITNSVDPHNGEPFYSAFLDARGRVLWDIFVWPNSVEGTGGGDWSCFIDVDGQEVDTVLRHLKKHKLRSKVTLKHVPREEHNLWTAWGAESQGVIDSSNFVSGLVDPRADGFGIRLLHEGPPDTVSREDQVLDLRQYQIRRYMLGIPEGQAEIARESALPLEYNIDLSRGINFKKGCYVGQELTIRTKHTGIVRKRILPVQLYRSGEEMPISLPSTDPAARFDPQWSEDVSSGVDIKQLDENGSIKKGRAAGKLIASVGNVGLALCRLEMMTPLRVSAEGGTFKPGMEFGLQADGAEGSTSQPIRIKAFVPEWLIEREKEVWDKGRQRGQE